MKESKEKDKASSAIQITKIIGMGSKDKYSLSFSKKTGRIAYICGPYAIIYDGKINKQISFIQNKNNKSFSCIDFSQSGNILACGEGRFKNPEIIIYDVTNEGK